MGIIRVKIMTNEEGLVMRESIEAAKRADRAEELFRMGYNCSQTVACAFADVLGMEVDEVALLMSPFGAGFGQREICGAVTGMAFVLGKVKGYNDPEEVTGKRALYAMLGEMSKEFEADFGSVVCRDMLGLKKGEFLEEPAVRTEEFYETRPCLDACRKAAMITANYIFGE